MSAKAATWLNPPAVVKVPGAITLVVSIAALPPSHAHWAAPVVPLLLAYAVLADVPLRRLAQSVIAAEPYLLAVSILLLFRPNGLALFAIVIAKATLCLAVIRLLASTTPFHETIEVLRKARVPSLLVTTLSLLQRYLPILGGELSRMRRARAARNFGGTKRTSSWPMLASVIGVLFIRSTERAERVDAAMRSRGWS